MSIPATPANLEPFSPNSRMMIFQDIPVDFVNNPSVQLGQLDVDTTRFFVTSVIVDFQNVLSLATVPIAIVNDGTTGQNITASTTFTSAATGLYWQLLTANPGYVCTGDAATVFPNLLITVNAVGLAVTFEARASNVATLTTTSVHGLTPGQVIWVSGMDDSSFDGHVTVTSTPTTSTFTYNNIGPDVATTSEGSGTAGACDAVVHTEGFYF